MAHDTGTPPTTAPAEIRLLLRTPRIQLTEMQIRGITCVWCGIGLSPATAVSLGERTRRHLDGHLRWWPQGCHPCTQAETLHALHVHAPGCPDCQSDYQSCPVGLGLNRLLRECR